MKILFSKQFDRDFKKFDQKTQTIIIDRLNLLISDNNNRLLNNHSLSGKLKNLKSINISGDIRLLYQELSEVLLIVRVGTHSQLYN